MPRTQSAPRAPDLTYRAEVQQILASGAPLAEQVEAMRDLVRLADRENHTIVDVPEFEDWIKQHYLDILQKPSA